MKEINYSDPISFFTKLKKFFSFKKPLLKNFWFYLFVGIVSVFLIFIIPIIINELYKNNSGYITLWDASDVLSYYSVILTGILSVSILAITILATRRETNKQIRYQLSQAQFPFFQIDWIRISKSNAQFKKSENQKWNYTIKINDKGELIDLNNALIDIHLNNIGNSIALTPSYEIDMFAGALISEYAINQKEGLIVQYDLNKNLMDKYVHRSIVRNINHKSNAEVVFCTYISVHYKNIWDIKLKQNITIELAFNSSKNTIKISINPISSIVSTDI